MEKKINKKRCGVCGKRLKLDKSNKYEVTVAPVGVVGLIEKPTTYECFDCEKCGCQNIVNIKEV